jgi:heme A synthase
VRVRAYAIAPAILGVQILLGAMNVWLGEHPGLIVTHLTVGTLLWASVVLAGMSLIRVPAPAGARAARTDPAPEAAAA